MSMELTHDFLQRALRHYYGYDSFRTGQEEIVRGILSGRPVLAVLPTGAGKSLCFQLPSLLLQGMTLVVSPLISLMKDQAEQLRGRGISAEYLDSSMPPGRQGQILYEALQGRCKFLYVAPERLRNAQFASFAKRARITLVAVDEAHCVSQWGRSFRRDYYHIPEFIAALPRRPLVAAFTATATPEVRRDILRRLQMPQAQVTVSGFDRPNLHFAVQSSTDKKRELLDFLRVRRSSCGIIYCLTRAGVEQTAALLLRQGYPALRYHAGLTPEERRRNQRLFVSGKIPLIAATNAFGMGIDKADVRFVLHYNMPKDLEGYYQEAGRAGRDGLPAECLLLYNAQDIAVNNYLISSSGAPPEVQQQERSLLGKMAGYCSARGCLRHYLLTYFGESSAPVCHNCGNCVPN